jgi:molecular chaperone HtpG
MPDACDKRLSGDHPAELAAEDTLLGRHTPDAAAKTLTIADNGIGMNREELVAIPAPSRVRTAAFLKEATAIPRMSLIGQFGVGFMPPSWG